MHAQVKNNLNQIDSLSKLIPHLIHKDKVLIMAQIGRVYESLHSDSSLYFAQKALSIAETADYDSGIMLANHQIGDFYQNKRDYLKAFVHYKESYDLLPQSYHGTEEAKLIRKLGFNYFMRGDYKNALHLYEKALAINKKLNNHGEIANILKNIGIALSEQGNYEKAKVYLLESIEIFQQIGDEKAEGSSSNNLAMVFIHDKQYEKAYKYALQTLKIREKHKDISGIANAYTIIGRIHQAQKQTTKAIDYYNKAMEIRLSTNDLYNIAYLDTYFSDIYFEEKQYTKSIVYAKKSLQAFSQNGVKTGITYCYEQLCKNYEAIKDYQQALHFYKLSATFKDSLLNEEKTKAIANLEATFEIELKEREILEHKQQNQLLSKEQALQKAKIEEQYILVISISGALMTAILFAGVFYQIHRKDQKSNKELLALNHTITTQKEKIEQQTKELQQANAVISAANINLRQTVVQTNYKLQNVNYELDTFLYHTSHDLRQPLVNFTGIVEVARISVKEKEALYLFDLVGQIANKMDKMLRKMQIINHIYADTNLKTLANLDNVLENLEQQFKDELAQVDYQVSNQITYPILINPYLLSVILTNLVENSLCYQKQCPPSISLTIYQEAEILNIIVKDNGEGIPEELLDKIFEMYFRGSENSKGNGLGLYIVKKAIEQLNGSITVESLLNKGTTFLITIPTKKMKNGTEE
jgi:signal transduction histidine kinase